MESRLLAPAWLWTGFVAGLIVILPVPAPAAIAPRLPVSAFGALPFMTQVEISPDGRYVAALLAGNNRSHDVVIYDLTQLGKVPPFRAPSGDWSVSWIRWKSANRLLVSMRKAHVRRQLDTQVDSIETRLWAMNADGSDLKRLVQPKSGAKSSSAESIGATGVVQVADRVVDILPEDPRNILMAFNPADPARPRLNKVDVYNDRHAQVEPPSSTIQWWLRDQQGRVRLGQGLAIDVPGAALATWHRTSEKEDWKEIWNEGTRNASFNPVIFDRNDPDVLYVISDHENGRQGLYRYRISSGTFIDKLFLHPDVDLDEVVLDPKATTVEGVRYVTDLTHWEWFSGRMGDIYRDIRAQLPGWAITVESRALDDSRMVVRAAAPDHSPRYHLYEPSTKKLQYFGYTHGGLDEHDLARVLPVRYKARDGLEIPGYLTLPPGAANPPASPLPTVVMPHGGPESRDYAEFDPMVQMLANHGYAVLQMNFRGSAGFGAGFEAAGAREWGEAMQDDITDGTRWLVASGIADAARICLVGGSYGGYAALMGVVKEPGMYRCAVSLNGVTDLPDFVTSRRDYVGGARSTDSRIGELWRDKDKLERNSPARRAADIQVPVLLVHGSDDRVVPVAQSRKMAAALTGASKVHEYVELEGEDHWLTHADTRLRFFEDLDSFLSQQLR